MDLIFAGLVRRFGKENVIDYPARAKFREGKPKLVGDDEKDYGAERRSLGFVEDCEDLKKYTKTMCQSLVASDLIDYIWLDETDESFMHWLDIQMFTHGKRVKTVVVAGHDSFRGDPPNVKSRFGHHFCHMFIDDWMTKYDGYDFASLINLSCNFDHLWEVEKRDEYLADKKYDLCFIGYNSNPVRKVVIDHVQKKWGHLNNCIIFEDRPNRFDRFIRHDDMFKLMAQSKICINLPGASTGGRALRYYEIPYVGSAMLTMRFDAKLLHPFENMKTCLEFSSLDELDDRIDFGLISVAYEALAQNGHNHCMAYHTVDARMDYIFGVLDEQTATV